MFLLRCMTYQALACLTLVYPALSTREDDMPKFLVGASRPRITLRTTSIPETERGIVLWFQSIFNLTTDQLSSST